MIPFNTAINAYNSVAKPMQGMDTGTTDAQAVGLPSFGSLMKESFQNLVDVSHNAEQVSAKSLVGQASAGDVVTAMTTMETDFREFTKIRDGVVSAYQDILKMPI